MNIQQIFCCGLGALLIGGGLAAVWVSKSFVKKPKVKGSKRQFYTKGEVILLLLRKKLKTDALQSKSGRE